MPQEIIEGVVEDIIFYNPDNGYTVLSLDPAKKSSAFSGESVVVVGRLVELQPGETVRFTGTWTTHREYGEQFKAEAMHLVTTSKESLRRYVASGLIEGISDITARKITDHFGEGAMDILDQDPTRIREVPGIKPDRAAKIEESWAEQRKSRKVMMFLQNHGITAALAQQIYERYGGDTIEEVQADPYKLAMDIEGVGFKTADQIAFSLGLGTEEPSRLRAGIIYALSTLGNDGHIFAPRPMVVERAAGLLDVEAELCDKAITGMVKDAELVAFKKLPTPTGPVEAIYLPRTYKDEANAARRIAEMVKEPATLLEKAKSLDWDAFFSKLSRSKEHVKLTEQQQGAVHAALTNKISVLTGGPGTGKTTTLRAVIRALDSIKARYLLASPTGRAARRLADATGHEARTIHRLLGYNADGEYTADESAPLDADMVIIDETSMVDLELFSRLLSAITPRMHLMLVGDVDQLPSVGAGDVLRDVIASTVAHVTRLDAIFRQASDSLIVVNAHKVNEGEMPDLTNSGSDFFMFAINEGEPGAVADLVVDVVQNRIPKKFNLDPLNDVQVLAPMYKGDAGINVLNERLQAVLNPLGRDGDHPINGRTFRVGDKVIQTKNNYEKDVYNGDIGRITTIDQGDQTLEINFDGRKIDYTFKETFDLNHAFAISIHRSQGGEYPAIVIPIVPQYSRMLQRNLLYTAITRARLLVVLVGTRRAIQIAVDNNRVAQRYSGLIWQLGKLMKT